MIDNIQDRLKQQLNFLCEIDKLKTIFRRINLIADPNRFENSAEHSWHLAFYILILAEYFNEEVNLLRALKMVLLHDIVEIDAGDTFGFDEVGKIDKKEREQKAAERLFGLLPQDQNEEFISLWQEFEIGATSEAKLAAVVDRLQPVLHNYVTQGGSWKRHAISKQQVEKRVQPIMDHSSALANLVKSIINYSVENNFLKN